MNAGLLAAATVVVLGVALRPHPGRAPDGVWRRDHVSGNTPTGTCTGMATAAKSILRSARAGRPFPGLGRRRNDPGGPDAAARWCDELSRAARSGSTLGAAIRHVSAPTDAIRELQHALGRGVPLAAAITHAEPGDAHFRLAFTVIAACAEHGGPPAEPLDRAAATLRGRAADIAERRTHSAQARLSAVVMTWLPVAMLALLVITSAPVRAVLATPLGAGVLAAGGLLNLAGWRWMNRIIEGRR